MSHLAVDALWHALEWMQEDVLPGRPTRVRVRIGEDVITAEHDGEQLLHAPSALALNASWHRASSACIAWRALGAATHRAIEVDERGCVHEISSAGVDTDRDRARFEWRRTPLPEGALALPDVRAYLHHALAGADSPLSVQLELLDGDEGAQPGQQGVKACMTIEYEPPLPSAREVTAQWLGTSAQEVGACQAESAGVLVLATAVHDAPAAAEVNGPCALVLPLIDGLPLPAHKRRRFSEEVIGSVEWKQFGIEPARPPASRSGAGDSGYGWAGDAQGDGEGLDASPRASGLHGLGDDAPVRAALRVRLAEGSGGLGAGSTACAPRLYITVRVFVLALGAQGRATVHHWDELTPEQRRVGTSAVTGALLDLRARSPAAQAALCSRAERADALIRERWVPELATAIVAVAQQSTSAAVRARLLGLETASGGDGAHAHIRQLLDAHCSRKMSSAAAARHHSDCHEADEEADNQQGNGDDEEIGASCIHDDDDGEGISGDDDYDGDIF